MICIQCGARGSLQLWICETHSLLLYYSFLIIMLFSMWKIVNLLCHTLYSCVLDLYTPKISPENTMYIFVFKCHLYFKELKRRKRVCIKYPEIYHYCDSAFLLYIPSFPLLRFLVVQRTLAFLLDQFYCQQILIVFLSWKYPFYLFLTDICNEFKTLHWYFFLVL